MEKRSIEGVLESINQQVTELKKTHKVKVCGMTPEVKVVGLGKRIWHTANLELTEK